MLVPLCVYFQFPFVGRHMRTRVNINGPQSTNTNAHTMIFYLFSVFNWCRREVYRPFGSACLRTCCVWRLLPHLLSRIGPSLHLSLSLSVTLPWPCCLPVSVVSEIPFHSVPLHLSPLIGFSDRHIHNAPYTACGGNSAQCTGILQVALLIFDGLLCACSLLCRYSHFFCSTGGASSLIRTRARAASYKRLPS